MSCIVVCMVFRWVERFSFDLGEEKESACLDGNEKNDDEHDVDGDNPPCTIDN